MDKVYVGGRNRLFQLTSDLQIQANLTIGPRKANENLNIFDYMEEPANKFIDNVNKVLLIESKKNRLITCNTVPFGSCSTRSLQNISLPEKDVMESIVAKTEG